ncbi:MAG: hypothetical protein DI536_00980 [Archangium gephyra]|uniref:DUF4384 domain-containing protein n=1 Tax=Archangium gephyra TaxID=48 RepID=A0A2W5U1Y0_9BACT|nr:MAG: hypothetical protein DI536_00980 [Archangium gephyra]
MNARGHLSSETIDLLLLSALSADDANAARHHLDGCGECKQRWQELNEDKQRFEQFVFARTLPKVEARVAAERQGFFERFKLKFLIPVVGVAAALGVVAVSGPGTQTEDDLYVGIKGQPTLEVYAQRGNGGAFAVGGDTPLQPNDKIRFVVNPAGSKYVMVASHDGAGVFSVYAPFNANSSQPVEAKTKLELPGAVELDDTLGTERVVAVFSDEPLTAAQVEAALKSDAKNPSLKGARFVAREFRKVAP